MRIFAALLFALLLTACSAVTYVQVENAPSPNALPTEAAEMMVTAEKEQSIYYQADTVMHGDTRKTDDGTTLFSYAVEVPELTAWREDGTQITEAQNPAEEKALQTVQAFHERFTVWYADETLEELEKTATEDLKWKKEENIDWYDGYQVELNSSVYQTELLVSVSAEYYAYTGGAHPNTYLLGWTFDLENGAFYGPENLAGQELQAAVCEEIIRQAETRAAEENMKPEEFFWPEYQEIIAEWTNYAVSFDEEGMNVAFSPYELAAYAAGAQEFKMPYEWLKEYLDEHSIEVLGLN